MTDILEGFDSSLGGVISYPHLGISCFVSVLNRLTPGEFSEIGHYRFFSH
jgi:hypothetical protein